MFYSRLHCFASCWEGRSYPVGCPSYFVICKIFLYLPRKPHRQNAKTHKQIALKVLLSSLGGADVVLMGLFLNEKNMIIINKYRIKEVFFTIGDESFTIFYPQMLVEETLKQFSYFGLRKSTISKEYWIGFYAREEDSMYDVCFHSMQEAQRHIELSNKNLHAYRKGVAIKDGWQTSDNNPNVKIHPFIKNEK